MMMHGCFGLARNDLWPSQIGYGKGVYLVLNACGVIGKYEVGKPESQSPAIEGFALMLTLTL